MGAALVSAMAGVTGRSSSQAECGEGEELSNKQSWLKNGLFPSLPAHLCSEFFLVRGGIQEKFGRSLFSQIHERGIRPLEGRGVG